MNPTSSADRNIGLGTGRIRRLAEAVLGPWTIRRRLPSEAGGASLWATGRAGGLKYVLKRSRSWDPELLRVAGTVVKEGDVVWDVGANLGLFSCAAAYHSGPEGRVIALEPDTDVVRLLLTTAQALPSDHASITVLPMAVGGRVGFAGFAIARRARASNAILGFGSTQTGGVAEMRTVPTITLDSLADHFPPPDVLKIDVERAEISVLMGAKRLMADVRPAIYCEVATSENIEAATELFEKAGYTLFDGACFEGPGSLPLDRAARNMVGIPTERCGTSWRGRNE